MKSPPVEPQATEASRQLDSPLKQARLKRKLTLQKVSNDVGTDTGNLSRIERGIQVPSKELAEALVKYFDNEINETQIIYPERFGYATCSINSAEPGCEMAASIGEFGEPRTGADSREGADRRSEKNPSFGELGEPRDGDRRQEDRRSSD
jgi:transcriptional regulator with XRE-family HTH domain